MHAKQQAEIAAWLAIHSETVITQLANVDALTCEAYWTNSKVRLNRWHAALKVFEQDLKGNTPEHDHWPALEIVVEEILASEMLTRIWSAMLVTADTVHQHDNYSGLAYSVFIGHIEIKNRTFRLLLSSQNQNEAVFDRLNKLRRSLEKWTDVFLSWLPQLELAQKFSFDRERLGDFVREHVAYDRHQERSRKGVLLSSLSQSLSTNCVRWGANPEVNRAIVFGVIAAINRTSFDTSELPIALRQVWLEKTHHEAEQLVAQLDLLERPRGTVTRATISKTTA